MLILSYLRLCGQAVKTQPSHGCYPGSNPGRVTNATLSSVVFYAGILPGYAYRPAIRTRCTLARLAVMRIPAESPMRRFQASFFYAGILPGYAYRPAIRTRCTLARLAVMRIPAESPMRRFQASFFYAGILPGYAYRLAIRTRCTLAFCLFSFGYRVAITAAPCYNR